MAYLYFIHFYIPYRQVITSHIHLFCNSYIGFELNTCFMAKWQIMDQQLRTVFY